MYRVNYLVSICFSSVCDRDRTTTVTKGSVNYQRRRLVDRGCMSHAVEHHAMQMHIRRALHRVLV